MPSPLLGYNNNVRHKGKVFHIQTEDSGVKYGHIITHLFMDGGRILKSVKTSYSEYVENDRMAEIVREMMKQQHKAMFIALRDGKFDAIVDGVQLPSSQSLAAAIPLPPPSEGGKTASAHLAASRLSGPSGVMKAAAPGSAPALPAPPQIMAVAVGGEPADGPQTLRQPLDELPIDVDALERAATAASSASPVVRATADLPPPPESLFRDKSAAGKYRVTPHAVSPRPPNATPSPTPPPLRPPSSGHMPIAGRGAAERRYAPTRPASIFGQARPQQGKSIFGEDLISDKSLDEVILSYLAEDLGSEKK